MNPNKVTIKYPKWKVDGFVAFAKQNDCEYLGLLVGHTEGNTVHVVDILIPKQIRSEGTVHIEPNEITRMIELASPHHVVGTIHSQPDCDASPSQQDIRSAALMGETVFAIVGIRGDEVEVAWYLGMPQIELQEQGMEGLSNDPLVP